MNDLDTVLDRVQGILTQLEEVVSGLEALGDDLLKDPKATVDTMTVGGWMKLPGRERWRKIVGITKCDEGVIGCWRIEFATPLDPDGSYVHVDKHTAYPFLTAEQFDRACDRERVTA